MLGEHESLGGGDLSPSRGVARGLVGHALAAIVFLVVFLFDPEDPGDRAAGAVALSFLTGLVGSVVTVYVLIRRVAKGERGRGLVWMLTAWAAGAVGGIVAAIFVLVRTSDWSGHCPCDPPISLL
jgi:hypothetical protein